MLEFLIHTDTCVFFMSLKLLELIPHFSLCTCVCVYVHVSSKRGINNNDNNKLKKKSHTLHVLCEKIKNEENLLRHTEYELMLLLDTRFRFSCFSFSYVRTYVCVYVHHTSTVMKTWKWVPSLIFSLIPLTSTCLSHNLLDLHQFFKNWVIFASYLSFHPRWLISYKHNK